jgi:hypothetical protein
MASIVSWKGYQVGASDTITLDRPYYHERNIKLDLWTIDQHIFNLVPPLMEKQFSNFKMISKIHYTVKAQPHI